MRRWTPLVILSFLLVPSCLVTSCETSKSGRTDPEPGHRTERVSAPAAAIPEGTLVVAKIRPAELTDFLRSLTARAGGEPGNAAATRVTAGLFASVVSRETSTDVLPRKSTELPDFGPLAVERFAWFAIAEPPDRSVRRALRYGGIRPMLTDHLNAPAIQMALPTDAPKTLARSIRSYCETGTRCSHLAELRETERHLLIRLVRDPDAGKGDGAEGGTGPKTAGGVAGRVGFDEPTPALALFTGHEGPGLYATFEGLRRVLTLRSWRESEAALVHGGLLSNRHRLTMRGWTIGQAALATAAAESAQFVDAALIQGGGDAEKGGRVDVVTSAIRSSGDDSDAGDSTVLAPEPTLDEPLVTAAWESAGPETAVSGSSAPTIHPIFEQNGGLEAWSDSLRGGGFWVQAVQLASMLEAPRAWRSGIASKWASIDPDQIPTVVAAALGAGEIEREGREVRVPRGGVVLGWPAGDAPREFSDELPPKVEGMRLRRRWIERGDRAYLLLAVNDDLDSVFPGEISEAERAPFVRIEVGRLVDLLPRRLTRRRAGRFLESLEGPLQVTTVRSARGRIVRIAAGGDSPDAPDASALTRGGSLPAVRRFEYQRCRTSMVAVATSMSRAFEVAAPENRLRLFGNGRDRAESAASKCAKRLPDESDGFRRAAGSWSAWLGNWIASEYRYRWAKRELTRGCEVGSDWACERAKSLGRLKGWAHLPVGDFDGLPPAGAVFADRRWSARIHRDGRTRLRGPGGSTKGRENAAASKEWVRRVESTAGDGSSPKAGRASAGRPAHGVALAPDALAPVSVLRPWLDARRRVPDSSVVLAVAPVPGGADTGARTRKFELDPDGESPRAKSQGAAESTASALEAVVAVRPTGVEVHLPETEFKGPDRCSDAGPTFCLIGGATSIDDALKTARDAAEDQADDLGDPLHRILDAYPLHELYNAITRYSASHPIEGRVRIALHPEVPVTLAPAVASAILLEREGGLASSNAELRRADLRARLRDGRRVPVPVFSGWSFEVTDSPSLDDLGAE